MIVGLQGRRRPACAGVIIVAGIVAVTAPIAAQQPSFSARADYVRVDVEVRRGNAVVTGLTAADFEVLDNGVRQRVEIVAPSAFPVSVVLALDMQREPRSEGACPSHRGGHSRHRRAESR